MRRVLVTPAARPGQHRVTIPALVVIVVVIRLLRLQGSGSDQEQRGGLSPDLENFVMTKFLAPMPPDAEPGIPSPEGCGGEAAFLHHARRAKGRRADLQVNGLYCKQRHHARRQQSLESNPRPARTGRPMHGEPMSPSVWMFLVMAKNFFVMTKKRGGVWASAG